MASRWTKRPLNWCLSCFYTWYPRGHSFSATCPQCGSSRVWLGGCLGALILLAIVLPIQLLIVATRLSVAAIALVVLWGSQIVGWLGRAGIAGATDLVDRTAPAREAYVARARRSVLKLRSLIVAEFRWIISVRDDFRATQRQDFEVIQFVAKLLILSMLAVLLSIAMFRIVLRLVGHDT